MPDYHAKKSPSGMKRRLNCPGSDNLCATLPYREDKNRYAAEGTVAHGIGEECLLDELVDPIDFKGEIREADGFKFTIDDNMIEAVNEYVFFMRHLIVGWIELGYDVELEVEVWGSLKHLKVKGMEGGTGDGVVIVLNGNTIIHVYIADYKHGQGVQVYPEMNEQEMCYAEGVIYKLIEDGYKVKKNTPVTLLIAQPRTRTGEESILPWETTYGEIKKWVKEVLVPGVLLSHEPDAPLIPGDDQCRFCAAKSICPALHDKANELAISEFSDFAVPDLKKLPLEKIEQIVKYGDLLESFVVACRNHLKLEMEHGEESDDFKLVQKKTNRRLTEEACDEIFSPLLDLLPEDDIFERKMLAMGKIEKNLMRVLGKQEAIEEMKKLTTKPEGEIVIALNSDKRKAIKPSLESDFEDFVEDDFDDL